MSAYQARLFIVLCGECEKGVIKIGEAMTYEEAYMRCTSAEELQKMVLRDTKFAMVWNPDRLKPIENAMNKVANLRNWEISTRAQSMARN